jgi:hypothetical protein
MTALDWVLALVHRIVGDEANAGYEGWIDLAHRCAPD